MIAGAAVIPAAWTAHLPAELDERHVERRLHESPFASEQDDRATRTCSVSPLCEATEMAFCSLVSARRIRRVKTFIMIGLIMERP